MYHINFYTIKKIILLFKSNGKNYEKLYQSDGKNNINLYQSDGRNYIILYQSDGEKNKRVINF
jgi:hypothetical protein